MHLIVSVKRELWPYKQFLLPLAYFLIATGSNLINPTISYKIIINNFLFVAGSFIAFIWTFIAYRKIINLNKQLSKSWLFFSIALGFWFLGDLCWLIIELFIKESVFPSLADIFYGGSYPFFLWGSLVFPILFRNKHKRILTTLEIIIILLSSTLITFHFFMQAYQKSGENDILPLIMCIVYSVLNNIIIWSILTIFFSYNKRNNIISIAVYLTGLIILFISDGVYTFLSVQNVYNTGSYIDNAYFAGYSIISVGAIIQLRILKRPVNPQGIVKPIPLGKYMPAILFTITFLVFLIAFYHKLNFELQIFSLVFSLILALSIVYHTITVRLNTKLNNDLKHLNATLNKKIQQKTCELKKRNADLLLEMERTKIAEEELVIKLRYEAGVSSVMDRLLKNEEPASVIKNALECLKDAAKVSRVYIFENVEDKSNNLMCRQIYEVCEQNVAPQIDNPDLQNIPYMQGFIRWEKVLSQGGIITGHVEDFPDSEKEVLLPQGILSIIVIPLMIDREWKGFIGFDEINYKRNWPPWEINLLRTSANIIGEYLKTQKIKEKLAASEHKFKVIFENAVMGLYQTTPEGKIITANPALINMLEFSSLEELIKRNLNSTGYADNQDRLKFKEQISVNGIVIGFESIWTSRNGNLIYVRENAKIVSDPKNNTYYYIGTVENITQSKRTELELKESKKLLETVMNNLSVCIWMIDENSKGIFFNKTWLETRGKTLIQEYGDGWLCGIHADDEKIFKETLAHATSKLISFELDFRMLRQDGQYRWFNNSATPRFSSDGKFLGYLGCCSDITLRKNFEYLLEKTNNDLKEANEQKDRLFSIIGHDLKGHFNGILGFLELAKRDKCEPQKKDRFINLAQENAKSAFSLLEDLLEWGRIQTGKMSIKLNVYDLYSFSEAVILLINPLALVKSIKIKNLVKPGTLIIADEYMLNTVLRNLLTNAIKFSKQESEITLDCQPGKINTIKVIDTGIGIEKDKIPLLFELGKEVSQPGTWGEKGTGLGLLLCKEFVEKMGGQIWLESCMGKGTIVFFTLNSPKGIKSEEE